MSKIRLSVAACALAAQLGAPAVADDSRKDATADTQASNAEVLDTLPFADDEDFALASRGLIARPESLVIRNTAGDVIWTLDNFDFIAGEAPATVNPSLWRQSRLNMQSGLYEVTDGIYQVRGYDLSNLSIIEGDTGYIVVDPLITREVAAAAMQLVYDELGEKPIVAVIYSHSHADHFGGVKGVVSAANVAEGKTAIIAPVGFMDYAVSENVLAGNVMSRRASYMYGALLPRDARGDVGAGLGQGISRGEITLIEPTDTITTTGEERLIDGVRFVFINAPGAEAPAELMFYLPDSQTFYAAEEANALMHNLYTLRGAETRDARLWARYLDETVTMLAGDVEVLFGGHHWPRWGHDNIVDYLSKQRDLYKYIHDQTLRLANHGYTMTEISNLIELPDELAQVWYNRGYYGTLSHNSRAVYNKYLGYFDGNPATLDPLRPDDRGTRYVELAGGPDALLEHAREAYESGDYRWVVEVVNHLVFADPENDEARSLQADALEQLGYRAESGPWRNFYLTAAQELRHGVNRQLSVRTLSPDMLASVTIDDLMDYLAVRLNGPEAAGKRISLGFEFTDTGDRIVVSVENGVMRHSHVEQMPELSTVVTLNRPSFIAMMMAGLPVVALTTTGAVDIEGDQSELSLLIGLLDDFEFWFDIVTP